MRKRFTNRVTRWKGGTTTVTVRLATPVVEAIDGLLGIPDIRTRSDCLQDAAALWVLLEQRAKDTNGTGTAGG